MATKPAKDDIAGIDRHEERNPKWIKQSMTLLQAANLAHARHMSLHITYVTGMGPVVVAKPK